MFGELPEVAVPAVPGWLWWIGASLVLVLGSARLTRLVVFDDWPPTRWWRDKWVGWTSRVWENGNVVDGPWTKLFTCGWCFGPWAAALCLATAWVTNVGWVWWVLWGFLAAGYLASIVVDRDERD